MNELAEGFVRLRDICPSIIEDIRYFGENNFVGTQVPGYIDNCAIITERAAQNLKLAQEDFAEQGYSLIIYEGYRPQQATDHFVKWSKDTEDNKMQKLYYPRIDKSSLFNEGYIALRSAHTRGAAVDVSIIKIGQKLLPCSEKLFKLNDGTELTCLHDGSVDMGGHFDLLDEASWHDNDLITKEQINNRNLLRSTMEKHGFKMYRKEWWHYSLAGEPFPDTYFNFNVKL